MRTYRLVPAAALGLLVCACAGGDAVAVSSKGGGSAAPVPTSATSAAGQRITGTPGYMRRDMSKPIHEFDQCDPARDTVHDFLLHTGLTTSDPDQDDRAAAIVRLTAAGPARWNTPDGRRPTQALIDALQHPTQVNGQWPVEPSIDTPYTMEVLRVLRGAIPGVTVTAYVRGGTVGQDSIRGCQTAAAAFEHPPGPTIGHTYLVFFGRELTINGLGAAPVVQPEVGALDPYDPATGIVQDFSDRARLSDAMLGLPPG